MPDTNPQKPSTGLPKPKAGAPFTPGSSAVRGREVDLTALAPKQEPEPLIEQGIDLSGQPKIIFAAGRGKTGKTTLLRWIAEKTVQSGGETILADIDPSNASFSQYFEGVVRPETDNPAGVTRWLQQLMEHCVKNRQSAIVDLGGGDTTLRTLASEMPELASQIEASGLAPVMLYMLGTQAEDLIPALTLTSRGFSAKAQALVLNEVAIDAGATRREAFARITTLPGFAELARSSVQVWMPRLFAAEAVEIRRCLFHDARDGLVSPPLGIFDAARVRVWMDTMDRRFEGIGSWIP